MPSSGDQTTGSLETFAASKHHSNEPIPLGQQTQPDKPAQPNTENCFLSFADQRTTKNHQHRHLDRLPKMFIYQIDQISESRNRKLILSVENQTLTWMANRSSSTISITFHA